MIERASNGVYEDLLASRLLPPLGVTGLGWGPPAAFGATDQPVAHSFQNGGWAACEGCDNPLGLSAAGRAHLTARPPRLPAKRASRWRLPRPRPSAVGGTAAFGCPGSKRSATRITSLVGFERWLADDRGR